MRIKVDIFLVVLALFCGCSDTNNDFAKINLIKYDRIEIANKSNRTILVPLVDEKIPVTEMFTYKVTDCKVANLEGSGSQSSMFAQMDTLLSDQSKFYDFELFTSDMEIIHDSQLVYLFDIYDAKNFSSSPFDVESILHIALMTYRDLSGEIKTSVYPYTFLPHQDITTIAFEPCEN
ncbi:hypothetical protein QWY85_11245 [Neolewinella lacunae]|uniref:Lipoprotein n=1 Tax=Neolewinella lacunae TaxID=1517758 RepID=A0A923T9V3_9BACT|nr:hypothetical protein [Neolewinella lacunae]MBC6995921.1 hypothetical protein [Neolewinella lacunae]MDN3635236.1 hypothetical protein [Neolewinella lacunae]